jgi:hypothetical protein
VPRPRKNDLAIDQVRKLALRCVSAKSVECPAFIALGATESVIPVDLEDFTAHATEGVSFPAISNASADFRPHGSSSRVLVLITDSYGPLIELGIWSLSANSHFRP